MANGILTGIIDKNGVAIATGHKVIMRFYTENENVVKGVVRVRGYRYRQRLFCVEDANHIRYPFELMKKPYSKFIVIDNLI